jgi:PleD family two-component response regulator
MPSHERSIALIVAGEAALHRQLEDMLDGVVDRRLHATNLEAGLGLARQVVPDVVLSDADVDGAGTFDLVRGLRADPATLHVPVILLARRMSVELRAAALDQGVLAVLEQPPDHLALQAHTRAAIRGKRAFEELVAAHSKDALTGLASFDSWKQRAALIVRRETQAARSITVYACALRGLRTLNETIGEARTDELLRRAARAVQEAAGEHVQVCRRFGGQFLWVAAGQDEARARQCAQQTAALAFSPDGGDDRVVDVVLGVAHAPASEALQIPFEALLRSALSSLRMAEKREQGGVALRQLSAPKAA